MGRSLPDMQGYQIYVLDCTEIFIETPKDITIQKLTWSSYKHHNTIKFLMACSPGSAITFLSASYGGRTSDKDITLDSGFLDMFDPHDMIQADKGFNIFEECAARMINWKVPPGLRGDTRMPVQSVTKTKNIAALRILLEQVIRRLNSFRILGGQLPILMLPCIDKIIVVCASLTNLKLPVYRD